MNWLISPSNRLISLKNQLQLLEKVYKLHIQGKHLEDIFNEVSSDPDHPVSVLLKKTLDLATPQFPEELRFLGKRFADLEQSKPSHSWTLLNKEPSNERSFSKILFSLSGSVKATMLLAVNDVDKLPASIRAALVEKHSLSLSLAGELLLGASASMQSSIVKLATSANKTITGDLSYYFGHDDSEFVSGALLHDLRKLTVSPFEVKTLHRALGDETNLYSVRAQLDNTLSFDGNIGFSTTTALTSTAANTLNIGATFAFSLNESGSFDYLVTRDKQDPACIVVELQRSKRATRQQNQGLSIGIDLSGWAGEIYPRITEQLTDAGTFLQKFDDYLPDSNPLGSALGEALADVVEGSEWEQEIKSLLGFSQQASFGDVVSQRLNKVLSTTLDGWKEDTQQGAQTAFAELITDSGLPQKIASDLQSKVEKKFKQKLDELHEKLTASSRKIVESDDWKKVRTEADKLANKIQKNVNELDEKINALTNSVREELDAIQGRLNKLAKPFEDASKARINLAFEAMRREDQGKQLDIQFAIAADHADADNILQDLISGKIGPHLLDAAQRSPAIRRVSGSYKRYRSIEQEDHFNVVLFNLGFSGSTKVKIDTSISVDAQGNLVLLSSQDWQRSMTRGTDVRTLKIANAVEVASAGMSTSMTTGVAFTLLDKNLEGAELEAFMRPIENIGLVAAGTTDRGVQLLGGNQPNAQLDMSLGLTREQFQRLLARQPEDVLRIGATVFEELLDSLPPDRSFSASMHELVEHLAVQWQVGLEGVADTLVHYTPGRALATVSSGNVDDDVFAEFDTDRLGYWLADRYKALVGMPARRERNYANEHDDFHGEDTTVIEAKPGFSDIIAAFKALQQLTIPEDMARNTSAQNTLFEAVESQQQQINKALRNWYGYAGDAGWWIFGKKSPRLLNLSLLVLFSRLSAAGDQPSDWPLLSASLTYLSAQGKKREILS